jgi:hypothetical protein
MKKPAEPIIRSLLLLGLALGAGSLLFTQAQIRYDDIQADQLFRQGVARFHDGYHNEAVTLFQRSLAARPADMLTRTWLGRAMFHAGFESAAIQEWDTVSRAGAGSPALTAFLETLQARRGLSQDVREDFNFFPVNDLTSAQSKPNQFRRPAAVLPMSDGSCYLASFGTNSIIQIDATGHTMRSLRGGFTHFSGPYDLLRVGKRYYSSQMLSDQVMEFNLDGQVLKAFGGHGAGPGQLIGPQFLASDGGYLFVSDFGNRRIVKYDLDGNYIMDFGAHSLDFPGLERPTGLYWQDGTLYVGDASRKNPGLFFFDANGNLQGSLPDPRLAEIEDIAPFQGGKLLITTRLCIYEYDPASQRLDPLYTVDKDPTARYAAAVLDANGNLVASDFDSEKLTWLARLAGVYAGLHVQVNRVVADKFPEVYVDVSVLDNLGKPVVGLAQANFTLTEGRKAIGDWKLISAGFRETTFAGAIITQADQSMANDYAREALTNAVGGIVDSLGASSSLALVSVGRQATVEAPLGSNRQLLQASIQNQPQDPFWYLDLGIRMAVPLLLKSQNLREVFFVGPGILPEDAFARYGLEENLNYLRNNRCRFTVIQTVDQPLDPALEYLVAQTGGVVFKLYNPKGLLDLGASLVDKKDGSYIFRFRSLFDTDFGRKYLPVEVEARLFQKSGRDEAGYFAPLRL